MPSMTPWTVLTPSPPVDMMVACQGSAPGAQNTRLPMMATVDALT